MQIKLNANIILTLQGDRELTEQEKGCVTLAVEQALNGIHVITLSSIPNLMVGVRVHISGDKESINNQATCAYCEEDLIITGPLTECKLCENMFCTPHVNIHEHCQVCGGSGRMNHTQGIGASCSTCEGTGLEE